MNRTSSGMQEAPKSNGEIKRLSCETVESLQRLEDCIYKLSEILTPIKRKESEQDNIPMKKEDFLVVNPLTELGSTINDSNIKIKRITDTVNRQIGLIEL